MESTLLFPGQGAYHRGTLTELTSATPAAAAALEEIDDAVRPLIGRSIVDALLASPPPDLDELLSGDPELLQLGIYATSVALFAALQARGARPTRHVGHSFGEIAARVCAGAFTAGEGAELVHHRTRALIDAAVADGYMAALGLDSARAEGLLALLADPEIVVAVENRPTQTVLSGARAPMDRAGEVARGLAVSCIPLKSPY
ncbi:MAG: acyltransferase domain-containing protein, partial [Frankiaceae bacterium]|nr:acyltransferase domain-containing protein [Frankiaceae bacterium]